MSKQKTLKQTIKSLKHPIEYIEWFDPAGYNGWSEPNQHTPALCHTIAFVVHECEQFLTFAATITKDCGILDATAVPHHAIQKRIKLK